MLLKRVPTEKLNPAAYNPRKDLQPSDLEYQQLKRSIEEFGYVEPIVWNKRTGNVVGGHQRLKILVERGDKDIEVVVVDLDPIREKALNLALNKITGSWDWGKLDLVIKDLKEADFDIGISGFGDLGDLNIEREWGGMPEYKSEDIGGRIIRVHFRDETDVQEFAKLIGQKITDKTRYLWYPYLEKNHFGNLRVKSEVAEDE